MPTHFQPVIDAIQSRNNFLLSAHIDPEGDCVGSLLAVESLLRKLGKNPYILCQDSIPDNLRFLDEEKRWHTVLENPALGSIEAGIVVDCPLLDRIGTAKEVMNRLAPVLVNLDHHVSNQYFGTVNFVDTHAAACGEIIYDLFRHFRIPLSQADCRALYVSISTDTGSFKYSNTQVKTHEITADLLRHGLDVGEVNEKLYENVPKTKMELFKILLNRVEFHHDGTVASAILFDKDFKEVGAGKADLEGCVEYMRALRGVEVSFLIRESESNSKISFRAKGNFDVNRLANLFGGGGHRKASGCQMHARGREAQEKILEQIQKIRNSP
ncbi:MAG: bifunctional oligoribonuclease/PAP phosphatase NrnA [Candidatus Omnitrophica bacterium]|nr:bifunctional oligoribonuclease/PAP phosphatase NrnA [Candidatus Omnitrophota bacterium]